MSDAALTFKLGEMIEDFYYNECGIPLQLTVGASALKIFRTKYFKDYWINSNDVLADFERQAYFGGRTEMIKRGKQHTFSYDINSTYVSIMRDNEMPDVSSVRMRNYGDDLYKDLGENLDKHLAIIECIVKAPDNIYLGVLPIHFDNKLNFPGGSFRGTWCNVELIEAIKRGYKITQVFRYVFYMRSKKYFHDFAEFIWAKRIEYRTKGNKGFDKMIKRIGNSLYGKFGERHQLNESCKLSELTFKLPDNTELFEYMGETWARLSGDKQPSTHEFPCIPAFITAYARIKLLHGMESNQDSLIYTDTDCIKLTNPALNIPIGENLGEWKDEGIADIIFYRAKFYGDKHKGVPKSATIFEKTAKYTIFKFTKPIREGEAMRRNLIPNVWTEQFKKLVYDDNKRNWTDNVSTPNILFYDGDNKILTMGNPIKYNNVVTKRKFKPTGSIQERENNREKMRELDNYRMVKRTGGGNVEQTSDFKVWESEQASIYERQKAEAEAIERDEMERLDAAIAESGEEKEDYTIERKRAIIKAQHESNSDSGNLSLLLVAGMVLYSVLQRQQGGS
jgi:hypothetical protein